MDARFLEVLKQLDRGETGFKAGAGTLDDLKSFQPTIIMLRRMEKQGLVEILELHRAEEFQPKYNYVYSALVSLTDLGRRTLAVRLEREK